MVLGWGKKTVGKQEEEDMTMDEILASIRRYVTEDQNATREAHAPKKHPSIQNEEPQFEATATRQPEQPSAPLMDYNAPYSNEGMRHEQHHTLRETAPQMSTSYEQEMSFKSEPSAMPAEPEVAHHHHQSHHHHHHSHSELENGMTSEGTISAAAMALSKLAEIKTKSDQQAFEAIGALTLDALIANLARPMIKEWLDQNLPKIVEAMVEREIERIRNYSSK